MKKLLIAFVGLMCLLVLAVGGGLFWLSGYVNSEAFVRKVEAQAGKAIGAPVSIEAILLSTHGLEARQVRIPNPAPHQAEAFLALDRAFISIDWASLFEEELQVTRIDLNQPSLLLYQNEDGSILTPFAGKPKGQPKTGGSAGSGTPGTSASSSGLSIAAITLTDGFFMLKDSAGDMLVSIELLKVSTDYRSLPGGTATSTGTVEIPVLMLAGGIVIDDLKSPFAMNGNRIELPSIRGRAYGGDLQGAVTVLLAENDRDPGAYGVDLKLTGASLRELTRDQKTPTEGTVGLTVGIKGTLEQPKQAKGPGTLSIENLSVPGVESLKVLGSVLGLDVLSKGKADRVDGVFTIRDQLLDFSSLKVDSKGVDINLQGTLTFEKALNFKGDAVIEAGASTLFNQLAGDLLDNERQKSRTIPLKITGTVNDPKVDAETGAIAAEVGKSLFERFLGPRPATTPDSPSGDKNETKPPSLLDSLF